ncbi:aminotransferase class V-fold PLP-dependent enzyme [Allohahella marinimesophila]|uniref:Aminotransferase class V-fold PLP-dependent enzyme n=1 Tax=Allohahella marinimesophila TaxID=1054972 RepID=A0ABP7P2M3_9GAMM
MRLVTTLKLLVTYTAEVVFYDNIDNTQSRGSTVSVQYPAVDPEGLLEFSVVFTDRALNHMSAAFQGVMRDISSVMREVYNADAVAIVPGGGTYGMEAVARQFASGATCLVIRNGWFSYRWSQILEAGSIPEDTIVMNARPVDHSDQPAYAPPAIDDVVRTIRDEQPAVVFAPHVETASGMLLPDDYLAQIGEAVHEYGGLFVLDCVASGALWVDMKACHVDVLISAPQKGWSSSPCSAIVMFSELGSEKLAQTKSTSFANDLGKWRQIMQAYEAGGHAYHATMPTDALAKFRDNMLETQGTGFAHLKAAQVELGRRVRALFAEFGFKSVSASDYAAPGVVVSYTGDPEFRSGAWFRARGLQTAAGVPLMIGESADFSTFRVGLFGLEKWNDIDGTVANLERALSDLPER